MGKGEMQRRYMGRLVAAVGLGALAPVRRLEARAAAESWEPVTVQGLKAPLVLELADGRSLRPAGIAAPVLLADGREPPTAQGLETRLAALVGEGGLTARMLGIDRYGRRLGLLRREGGALLQAELLEAGSVLVWQDGLELEGLAAWRQAEARARVAGRGLWAPSLGLVEAAARVRFQPMRLAVVEGRVQAVGGGASWIYLNFGADRNRDFTCRVSGRDKRRFQKAGLPLEDLAGRALRVRGWLFGQGGPMIEARDPSQIELL